MGGIDLRDATFALVTLHTYNFFGPEGVTRTEQKMTYNEMATHIQLVLQTAVHNTAGRREFCKACFSLLQLAQEVLAWMEKND